MKNIHVIPTDKPSRLVLEIKNNNLFITTTYFKNDLMKHQNIYITSDEEIKEGDYGLSKLNEIIKFHSGYDYRYYAKIILTTDKDLDGVEVIDDEFLDWFVNNPSCEFVKIVDDVECLPMPNIHIHKHIYKIIMPQEEPTQENCCTPIGQIKRYVDCKGCDRKPKQDPLEEAAKEYSERHLDVSGNLGKYLVKAVFQDGVKWEQEQDKNKYSEEEVKKIAFDFYYDISHQMGVAENLISENVTNVDVWFKQFKKKI
jgi:hypothetical protein